MNVKPTRSALLKTKKRIQLAKKGHELLKKKQDSLIMEFFTLLKIVKGKRTELQEAYSSALKGMNEARALESDIRIRASSLAIREGAPVKLTIKNIAGVKVPEIEAGKTRGAPIYDSILIQDAGVKYTDVVEKIVELAARETALRKVLEEVKKTKRRAHALEKVFIPDLEAAKTRVELTLEEREREEFSRLKRMKA